MVYDVFLQTVKTAVEKKMGKEYHILLRQIPKNNGILLDGLCIGTAANRISPAIYLNSYYSEYEHGMSMDDIVAEIFHLYQDNQILPGITIEQLTNFQLLKDKILYKLIQTEPNVEYLKNLPHVSFLDLSIIFYLQIQDTEEGLLTAMIHNEHLKAWNLSMDELYKLAAVNTPRLLPPVIRDMSDVLKDIAKANMGDHYNESLVDELFRDQNDEDLSPLYVLTNSIGVNGACCILYNDVLKEFAAKQGKDLIVLPSSIHEVLLIPKDDKADYEDLSDMVAEINECEVPLEDQLSNQVYLYTRSDNLLTLVSHNSVSLGETPS